MLQIDLKEDHKGLFHLRRHIQSDMHKLNVELKKNPDMTESKTLKNLRDEFPELILNKSSIQCRVCKKFLGSYSDQT